MTKDNFYELRDVPLFPSLYIESHEKRGLREGAMVSRDLSRGKELTTEYVDLAALQNKFPTIIEPTEHKVIVNAKGDWNKNTSFRPDYIVIEFNLRLEDITSICQSAGGGNG